MAIEVTMPKFGLTMHEGTLQRYFKSPNESIRTGEPLYEVETEKVLYVVEAPAAGILALWVHPEGTIVECSGLVAVIAEAGEDAAGLAARYRAAQARSNAAAAGAQAAAAGESRPAPSAGGDSQRRPTASPVARKRAAELAVDLARVKGTGPAGRITREDVEAAAKSGGAGAASAAAPGGGETARLTAAGGAPAGVPLRGIRRAIATRMHQSLQETAQLTITTEADVTAATELRSRLTREFDFTYTDMIIHAVARALTRHTRMNSRLQGDMITAWPAINVGMAVALDEGLIVPVIADAAGKTLREIAIVAADLAARARASQLRLEDVSGGTFTVTNLGTWGIDAFTPILNPGETGILGVGRIVEKPAVYRGEITRRSMLTFSLTFDHRIIDGAPAASFLQSVVDILNYGDR